MLAGGTNGVGKQQVKQRWRPVEVMRTKDGRRVGRQVRPACEGCKLSEEEARTSIDVPYLSRFYTAPRALLAGEGQVLVHGYNAFRRDDKNEIEVEQGSKRRVDWRVQDGAATRKEWPDDGLQRGSSSRSTTTKVTRRALASFARIVPRRGTLPIVHTSLTSSSNLETLRCERYQQCNLTVSLHLHGKPPHIDESFEFDGSQRFNDPSFHAAHKDLKQENTSKTRLRSSNALIFGDGQTPGRSGKSIESAYLCEFEAARKQGGVRGILKRTLAEGREGVRDDNGLGRRHFFSKQRGVEALSFDVVFNRPIQTSNGFGGSCRPNRYSDGRVWGVKIRGAVVSSPHGMEDRMGMVRGGVESGGGGLVAAVASKQRRAER
ncbi:hypothetical protein R3P38DRAFT_2767733 [Favolaschia claudopus]|uniref:Uncharacterized protein n=1 Tax=Favolaschia claudopus TaxID=2862362 RepID=A0AAW0CTM6_9AGAR